jgi:DNA-binding transcriptional MerR regulator
LKVRLEVWYKVNNDFMSEQLILIGALATQAGVSTQTIRFYEREGLLPRPKRSPGGYRVYPVAVVAEIQFIRECLTAGFTLREIKPMLRGQSHESAFDCKKISEVLKQKIRRIDEQMESLRTIRISLSDLLSECGVSPNAQTCRALDTLRAGGSVKNSGIRSVPPQPEEGRRGDTPE